MGELFAVEDTRVFKELLNHLGISLSGKKIMAFHDQSEEQLLNRLIDMAKTQDLYVASDAGSPIISDPAYPLIVKAYEEGIKIESYSGVSSPIMALELSGLPPIPFTFHGFLPRESSKKTKIFNELGVGTHIFFEAPTRIEETMNELGLSSPNYMVAIVRELSKKFEQVVRCKAGDWKDLKKDINFKGEFILLIYNEKPSKVLGGEVQELAQDILSHGASPKQLAKLLGVILEQPTKDIYSQLNRHKVQG